MAVWTHAITINAPPAQVWPWLAQLGAGRGGWYSFDFLDNGGRPSATDLLPDCQGIVPGDVLPAMPGATDAFIVAAVEPPRELILVVPVSDTSPVVSWAFVLNPLQAGQTRLLVRARASEAWRDLARNAGVPGGRVLIHRIYRLLGRLPAPLMVGIGGFGHWVMEAKMLRGIRSRAESSAERKSFGR